MVLFLPTPTPGPRIICILSQAQSRVPSLDILDSQDDLERRGEGGVVRDAFPGLLRYSVM